MPLRNCQSRTRGGSPACPQGQGRRRADALKEAIRRVFRNPDTGLFDYLAYESDAQESLGLAFAVLFGIADKDRACSVFDHAADHYAHSKKSNLPRRGRCLR